MAGLGTSKAQRYFAADLISFHRLHHASGIEVIEVTMSVVQHAVLHTFGRYSRAVPDQAKISENE
ncbi:hypothetical protein FXV83_12820 [Bradyrhizobium hipponense]|uniref:Uncharacterized protein n=1 Tax=Bradyrhizobium hipponense TaxID=2605638 RepID=A0A5S4YP45_9BRAD|nr:hypothetical protein [Bradyrhizobium hipponense]TYO66140.1 hypothetical protein FXV83_12820 [Bradyrhizobium hipponense]